MSSSSTSAAPSVADLLRKPAEKKQNIIVRVIKGVLISPFVLIYLGVAFIFVYIPRFLYKKALPAIGRFIVSQTGALGRAVQAGFNRVSDFTHNRILSPLWRIGNAVAQFIVAKLRIVKNLAIQRKNQLVTFVNAKIVSPASAALHRIWLSKIRPALLFARAQYTRFAQFAARVIAAIKTRLVHAATVAAQHAKRIGTAALHRLIRAVITAYRYGVRFATYVSQQWRKLVQNAQQRWLQFRVWVTPKLIELGKRAYHFATVTWPWFEFRVIAVIAVIISFCWGVVQRIGSTGRFRALLRTVVKNLRVAGQNLHALWLQVRARLRQASLSFRVRLQAVALRLVSFGKTVAALVPRAIAQIDRGIICALSPLCAFGWGLYCSFVSTSKMLLSVFVQPILCAFRYMMTVIATLLRLLRDTGKRALLEMKKVVAVLFGVFKSTVLAAAKVVIAHMKTIMAAAIQLIAAQLRNHIIPAAKSVVAFVKPLVSAWITTLHAQSKAFVIAVRAMAVSVVTAAIVTANGIIAKLQRRT